MAKQTSKGKDGAKKSPQKRPGKSVSAKPLRKTSLATGKAAAKRTMEKGNAKRMSPGSQYSCDVCGLVVSVDEACGCAEAHEIICCGEAMEAV